MNSVLLFTAKYWPKVMFAAMIACIFINTIGRSIPIYFTDPEVAKHFGSITFYLTIISVAVCTYQICCNLQKYSRISSFCTALFTAFLAFVIVGLITFFDGFTSFTDSDVLFVKRDNPDTKIIRRYADSGALGDGYNFVLRTDITSFLKYEKIIDTATINKSEWVKQNQNSIKTN